MTISSPCVNICKLDEQDVCIGCLRTRDEIARWTQMTERERCSIMAALKHRQRATESLVRGENAPNHSRIEPLNRECGDSFPPLLAKRGEGRGEEPQGTGGTLDIFFGRVHGKEKRSFHFNRTAE